LAGKVYQSGGAAQNALALEDRLRSTLPANGDGRGLIHVGVVAVGASGTEETSTAESAEERRGGGMRSALVSVSASTPWR